MVVDFRNEPFTDFSKEENRRAFEEALETVRAQLGREYDLIIGGERIRTEEKIRSINPSNVDETIGYVSKANQELAEKAMQAAAKKFEEWKAVSPEARARILFRAAAILRRRKHEFSAWMVHEAGKNWPEADADTAEAIDFMEFYGREMIRLSERQPLTRIPGEDNELYYIPLGVGVVIPPWNFPLAIMVGMTTASLVAGNTVVLKPASNTAVIAAKFMEILQDAGLPDGVVNYVPGPGGEVGEYLVKHPLTRFVAFTGSRDVGLRINELAAQTAPGQKWIKRVIAEMGGKDSIIVDKDADLDLAAQTIVTSAFGFSGQKCSACSRAIVLEDVYDEVLNKVVEKTKQLKVAEAKSFGVDMGPVIDENAYRKILEYIEIGKKEGRLMTGGGKAEGNGYFIQPTIFADVSPDARIAQEEIFGPVLAFIKAKDFDDALRIANNTEYGLTGSVISRNRANLEKARTEFHVGNLYFNRKCTGALVGVHPFGGFNMSGTDSKAGGYDYLLLFTQAKLVSEVF
ncbi:delta-1-pyrroline-5-carboxylate dehydrogenase [Planifilum fulgidum]|jgi:1-pyrroline-5-carboxylate dehydrogenase|uniref:L-glutamate gamma-semialdehyde dehydrogenase n=1 Tax=Planifilum fulgidum TaxID=201973 RepID=A0A1I2RR38_9BACL|nr:L-glutamate gamma-semialdehyde dehydrogenase [Planifilum fulgidum]MBO2496083.1 L-glutamate gamma-semialdehyde dehydrogenase [Bacillota bacterium]MBO2533374.1 L-glutamate gamma-semialdehyde dehydrogenase [Thermoactinomycetaceae bacterium]SFG41959.1 delta-1-pyrroline-5-carboxylate dehydrogenase [Planifilum fulgidum]